LATCVIAKKVTDEAQNLLKDMDEKSFRLLVLDMACIKDTHFETHAHIISVGRVAQHRTVLPETVAPADGVKVQWR